MKLRLFPSFSSHVTVAADVVPLCTRLSNVHFFLFLFK